MCVFAFLQLAQMLLNSIGETVTGLFSLAVKWCDGSWLTQLLLMLRSHVTVLRTLCAIVCHLLTTQADTLSDCHAHALAAITVHWNNYADCSSGIRMQQTGTVGQVAKTLPLASYILESLPLSTTTTMSFSLLFAVSYIVYAKMISHDSFTDENRTLADQRLATPQKADECVVIPDHIAQLLSYLGPRLIRDLRLRSSNLRSGMSVVSYKFSSVERFLSNDTVRSMLEQNRLSFESWVRKEIEVVDEDDLSTEWLCEYYNWVVFTRWHQLQSVADAATPRTYFVGVLQALAHAVLDFDTSCRQPQTCCCRHNKTRQRSHLTQNGRQNIFSFLQASRC